MAYLEVTLAEFRQVLRGRFDGVPFWTPQNELMAINDGLRTWNMLTGTWRTRVTFETDTPNETPWYTLPGCLTYSTRVTWNGIPLDLSSIDDLDNGRVNWEGEATSMHSVDPQIPERPVMWAPAGIALIAIWPYDVAGCDALVVDGVARTPVLVKETDKIDIGQEDFHTLLDYDLHFLAFKEGGARFKSSLTLYKEFIWAAGERNSRFKTSQLYRRIMGTDLGRSSRPVANVPTALDAQGQGA
jgi:hypothetical protein